MLQLIRMGQYIYIYIYGYGARGRIYGFCARWQLRVEGSNAIKACGGRYSVCKRC